MAEEKEESVKMPVISINKKYLVSLFPESATQEEIMSHIEKFGCSIEAETADTINVEVSPNRPDLFGAVGLARSLKNFMHKSRKYSYSIKDGNTYLSIEVGRRVLKIRPFISAFVAMGTSFSDDSLADLINFTEKLCETYGRSRKKMAVGLHDLDKISGELTYDAYPDDKFVRLGGEGEEFFSEVIKNTEKGSKYSDIIENAEGLFPALKDSKGTISLIPILNSERTRTTTKTRNIFVDITGIDGETIDNAADLISTVLMDAGAEVRPVEISRGSKKKVTPQLRHRELFIQSRMAENEIGVRVGPQNIVSLGNKMGYEAAVVGNRIRFTVPPYRMDVFNEQDIIEDIAIGYGYDYIQPVPIPSSTAGQLDPRMVFFREASEAMLGLGFTESMSTFLSGEESNFADFRIGDYKETFGSDFDYVKLKNAKSQSITMMRTWIMPSLMKAIGASRHEAMPQRLFELDMVFWTERGKPVERNHLAAIYVDSKSNFNSIKAAAEAFLEWADLEMEVERADHSGFIEGRCAAIVWKGKKMGILGEMHPETLRNFGVEEPASAFEIDIDGVFEASRRPV